ncbi:AraC family transcriptional regulator [Labrys neptuniae]|uniref:AraC family transcriptional regulator n=1 Tax=Labrys neptuniae TaxID=376174 RepID=UPI00288EAC6B|nr:AraC family transcriptional regulator [Labrys neptuniae]MDT3376921.1 AraC family transcriptional regulator [Labrys neptuniae]
MPTSTGYEIADGPGYDWDGRKRGNTPFSILQHTIAGAGQLLYEKRSYTVGIGETMLVTIPHAHRYWVERGGSWSFFWIAMCGHEALRLHRAILSTAGPVLRLRSETIDLLADVAMNLTDAGLASGRASGLAYHATMALHDDVLDRHEAGTNTGKHLIMARVIAHIRRHLDRDLNVCELADVAGMSRAHFSRTFHAVEGVAPSEFVMRERLHLATRLLVNSQLSIKAITSACGFTDPNYFAKAFRRSFAISPSEFRTTGMYAAQPIAPQVKAPKVE